MALKTYKEIITTIPDVIYNKSQYIYWMDHNTSGTNWGNNVDGTTFTVVNTITLESLSGGNNGTTVTDGQLKTVQEIKIVR